MKTRNLTQSSLRNDPINRRMHGFSFRVFEDEIEVQDVISPLYFDQILISSIPWIRKCIKNTRNQMAHELGVWTVRISRKIQGPVLSSQRTIYLKSNLGVTVDLMDSSRSTVVMMCRFANWCLKFVIVRSSMKASDASTLIK